MAFWDDKTLEEMTTAEWEALCDGCARCCLIKLEDEDTGEVVTSDVHCRLMEPESCLCSDYENRKEKVPDCIKLDPGNVKTIPWMPVTCAYRRLAEGRGLAWWHPLVSGDPATVHQAGISIRGRSVSETEIAKNEWEDHVVEWPDEDPHPGE